MRHHDKTHKNRQGFALIITISMMVLLTLMVFGLLTLSTLTLRTSQLGLARSQARANAKLALVIALGELQKTMGPDTRISARAETLAKDPRLGVTINSNTAKAWWVGVSNSDPDKELGLNRPVTWLVSGLDPSASPAAQISAADPFEFPVPMFGAKSINTDKFTNGKPILAGSVMVRSSEGKELGGYAYFIDDNGMKAQLAASDPDVRNDHEPPFGGGVLPGTYNLGILDGMGALESTPMEDYHKLNSLNDLPLIATTEKIVRDKRLGYTIRSQGVLSDVRKGGLKRDLTIAFERDGVFKKVFPSRSFNERYLVMDAEKLKQSRELGKNGYIHWDMFKDYYNLKKYIIKSGRSETLDPVLINKEEIFSNNGSLFGKGQLGPHAIGRNRDVPSRHQTLPYGDYPVLTKGRGKNAQHFKHSPVNPILSRMQQNAWVEVAAPSGQNRQARLKTHVQLWVSHYNPYNITLKVLGDEAAAGPRIINYPQVRFSIPGLIDKKSGLGAKRQSHVPHVVNLGPGRSHVCAFKNDGKINAENDRGLYDDKVQNLTLESVFAYHNIRRAPSGPVQLQVDFFLRQPSMSHGADDRQGSFELSQVMWAPFAWDAIDRSYPGKTITKTVDAAELGENSMISHSFHLRTTRESYDSLRPLIDGNIRATLCNTKWDAPLGVSLLAAYSSENDGEADEPFFPMSTVNRPAGYSYWGASRDPLDGSDRVILFDVPREDLVSLGQLQHANVGRFSYEPTYIVGNSYANLRIPLSDWKASVRDTYSTADRGLRQWAIRGKFNLYDASYLVNEELWDSYIFTTIPQVADNYRSAPSLDIKPTEGHFARLLAGDAHLPNPRFIPYQPQGSKFDLATLQDQGSGTQGSFFHNAGHLLVDGAFNVNSTSVDAWEAFLSGTYKLPFQKLDANGSVKGFDRNQEVEGVRFPRIKTVYGGPMQTSALDENYWVGFRELTSYEVRDLAGAIVEEVKKRGPFLSLGEFVNRKLAYGEPGERGALQAALDLTVNKGLDNNFEEPAKHQDVPSNSTQGAGFPGQLLQGDILQALSPYMTVRSDTFTIRAYGESRNTGSGEITARAWCEATVQRIPDPVIDPTSTKSALEELANPSSVFGRTFRMVSFRWLNANEI